MPVSRDIVRTYRGPRRVVRELLDMGQRDAEPGGLAAKPRE